MKVLAVCLVMVFITGCVAPPVTEKKKDKKDKGIETNEIDQPVFDVEYNRYLQEVVSVLEADPEFSKRISSADPEDIKSGKIANELEFVNHNVRSKLDELKRQELERLRHIAVEQHERANGYDRKHMKIPSHVDSDNPHTFEAEDLHKLIVQTTKELEENDRKRKNEFKEYEMRKELEFQEQLKHVEEAKREEAAKKHQEMLEKHKKHEPLHHPGSKQQLEQVWEEQDHLSPEDFNPKTFFHLHDLDGNGVWDANEVKALFKKELDKMYDPNAPEDDMRERAEEMERMREHVFNETDTNKDQLISFDEFLEQTKRQEFEKDEGWEGLDQQQAYSQDEYQQYAREHEEEIRRMMEQGLIPAAPPGYVPMVIPQDQHHPQGSHPQQQQHIPPPGQHPQQGYGGHPQMQYQQQHDPQHYQQPQGAHPQQYQQHQPQGGHPQQMQYPQGGHPQQMQYPQGGHPPQYQQQQGGHPQQMQYQQQQPPQGAHPQQFQGQQPHTGGHPQQGQFQQPPPPPQNSGQFQQAQGSHLQPPPPNTGSHQQPAAPVAANNNQQPAAASSVSSPPPPQPPAGGNKPQSSH